MTQASGVQNGGIVLVLVVFWRTWRWVVWCRKNCYVLYNYNNTRVEVQVELLLRLRRQSGSHESHGSIHHTVRQ